MSKRGCGLGLAFVVPSQLYLAGCYSCFSLNLKASLLHDDKLNLIKFRRLSYLQVITDHHTYDLNPL